MTKEDAVFEFQGELYLIGAKERRNFKKQVQENKELEAVRDEFLGKADVGWGRDKTLKFNQNILIWKKTGGFGHPHFQDNAGVQHKNITPIRSTFADEGS